MTYTHLTPNELVLIEAYFQENMPVSKIAQALNRSRQTIYKVIHFLKTGKSTLDYLEHYQKNKSHCGRYSIVLPKEQEEYVRKMVSQGWTPDIIIGRGEFPIACSVRTVYSATRVHAFRKFRAPFIGKTEHAFPIKSAIFLGIHQFCLRSRCIIS